MGAHVGLPPLAAGVEPIIGVAVFWSPPFLWFYVYYVLAVAAFAAAAGQDRAGQCRAALHRLLGFAGIAFLAVTIGVLNLFFVSHWIFRWRTAMNEYYMSHWPRLREIEGASQRVQEDTMRFSRAAQGCATLMPPPKPA